MIFGKSLASLCALLTLTMLPITGKAASQELQFVLPLAPHYELPSSEPLKVPAPRSFKADAPPQKQSDSDQSSPTPDEHAINESGRGARDALPSPKAQVGSGQDKKQGNDKSPTDLWLAAFTGGLVLVGVLQLFVFGRQAARLSESIDLTRNIADRQERDMRDSITEAARAASAMRDAADAALAQVRTMIAMEQPFFSWIAFRLEPLQPEIAVSGIMPDCDYRPVVIIRNIGKSPMQLRSFCIETMVAQEMIPWGPGRISVSKFGPIPKYSDIINVGYVVEAGKDAHLIRPKTLRFTAQETGEIQSLQRQFSIYGFVSYLNQFTAETWEAGFSALWQGDGFSQFPMPNYDYHRRQEPTGNAANAT
jgi:hypothetical protein